MTLELREQIAHSFMDWLGNKMNHLMLIVQCSPKAVSENSKNEMLFFLDDLLKRYIPYSVANCQAIDCLKEFVTQYPGVSLSQKQEAARMCEQLLLLFGVKRRCGLVEQEGA